MVLYKYLSQNNSEDSINLSVNHKVYIYFPEVDVRLGN